MRKPSLTVETFIAALAVVSASASMSCKQDRPSASREPAATGGGSAATSADTSGPGQPSTVAPLASAAALDPAPAPAPAPATDAAAPVAVPGEKNVAVVGAKPVVPAPGGSAVPAKKATMSCGAGVCSDDMKKGK